MDIRTPAGIEQVIATVDITAQVSGDIIVQATKIPGAARRNGKGGILQSLTMLDRDKKGYALEVHFFRSAPASLAANGAAADLSDADSLLWLGKVALAAADYSQWGSNYLIQAHNIGMQYQAGDGTEDIYFVVVAKASVDYTAATDLAFNFGLQKD